MERTIAFRVKGLGSGGRSKWANDRQRLLSGL